MAATSTSPELDKPTVPRHTSAFDDIDEFVKRQSAFDDIDNFVKRETAFDDIDNFLQRNKAPTLPPARGTLDLGAPPRRPSRSTAEGLVTEQAERRGAPLALTPTGIQPVGQPTVPVQSPALPAPPSYLDSSRRMSDEEARQTLLSGENPGAFEGNPENIGEVGAIVGGLRGYPKIAHALPRLARFYSQPTAETEKAATELVQGAGEAGTPLFLAAGAANPLGMVKGIAGGLASSYLAGKGAEAVGASPEAQDLLKEVAFWAGPALASKAALELGLKGAIVSPEQGKTAAGVEAFGGRVKAAGAVTPEEIRLGGKVGPFQGSVRIPRRGAGPAQPQLEPHTIEGTTPDIVGEASAAMARHDATAAQAREIVSGKPPTPTPVQAAQAEATKGPDFGDAITPQAVDTLSKLVTTAPEAERPTLLLQAHELMAKWMLQKGKFVGPDGKLVLVNNPDQANKAAADIINSEVERQDKLAEAQQQTLATAQAKAAEKSAKTVEVSPAAPKTQQLGFQIIKEEPTPQHEIVAEEPSPAVESANAERQTGAHGENGKATVPTILAAGNGEGAAPATRGAAGAGIQKAVPGTVSGQAAEAKPTFQKGSQVVLADGSRAEVTYAHPKMPIVRVKTADGRKLSVGIRNIKLAEVQHGQPAGVPTPEGQDHPLPERSNLEAAQGGKAHGEAVPEEAGKVATAVEQRPIEPRPPLTYGFDRRIETGPDVGQKIRAEKPPLPREISKPAERPVEVTPPTPGPGSPEYEALAKRIAELEKKTPPAKTAEPAGPEAPQSVAAPAKTAAPAPPESIEGDRKAILQSEISALKAQAANVSEEFSLRSNRGYDPFDPLRARHTELTKQAQAKEDELARLTGQPTRVERRELQKQEADKTFEQRPPKALTYGQPEQSQHWQVLEPDYIAKRFGEKQKSYERGLPEKRAEIEKLKPGTMKRSVEEGTLHFWEKMAERYKNHDPQLAQTFKTEYNDLVKKAVSQGRPVPEEIIKQKPEFILAKTARERYEKGRHTSFANRSAAINDTMQKEEGFKIKRQDGKPIPEEQAKEISDGVNDIVEVLGPELRDIMRGTDLTIAHTNGKHPFLSDAGGQYHPVDRSISAGVKDFLDRPIHALAHELGHWMDYEAGRVLNVKSYLATKSPLTRGKETSYVSEADGQRERAAFYSLARTSMTDTREVSRMLSLTKTSDLPDAERAEVERVKVVLGHYWKDPRELWARMFEQHIADKLGRESMATETIERYQKAPAWWSKEAWDKLKPVFEQELAKRMDALRERYAPIATPAANELESVAAGLLHSEAGSFEPGKLAGPPRAIAEYLKSEVEKVSRSRELQSGMYDLESQYNADVLRAVQTVEKLNKELGKEATVDYEAIYHHLENPEGVPLTPSQDKLLDDTILPIMEDSDKMYTELTNAEVPIENYVHRVVKGKGGFMDRIASGLKGGGRGNLLSKSAPQTKHRTMMAIENREGQRRVVSLKGGQVTAWNRGSPENLGPIMHTQEGKVFEDKDGNVWTLTQATTREIHEHTDLEYYTNALASAITSNLQLRKAVRGLRFIESFKTDPEFREIAMEQGKGTPPDGWRMTDLPQLRGYFFEPHTAEVLDWYSQKLKTEGPGIFDQVGWFMRVAMLINPIMHPLNVAASWTLNKGVTGFLPHQWIKTGNAGVKAIRAVVTQNQDFLDALDAGAPLQSQRENTRKLTQLFFEQLAEGATKKEPWALRAIKSLGFDPDHPAPIVGPLHKFSSKVAWLSNDILFLQSAYENQGHGMSLKDALKETARIIPDYRLPTRVLDSRALAKAMGERKAFIFAPYHFGLLKAFPEMAKSAFGLHEPPPGQSKAGDIFHGWDMLGMLALVSFALYPMLDELAKKATGDDKAKVRRAGPFGVVENLRLLARKERTPTQVATSLFTPNPLTKAVVEGVFNRELEGGHQIYDPQADWNTKMKQFGHFLGGSISTFAQVQHAYESEDARKKFAVGQLGVTFPRFGAEKVAQNIAAAKSDTKAWTPEDREHYYAGQDALEAMRKGNYGPLEKAIAEGKLSPEDVHNLRRRSRLTWLQDKVHNFSYREVMEVYNSSGATAKQKAELEPMIREKRRNLLKKHRGAEVEQVETAQ